MGCCAACLGNGLMDVFQVAADNDLGPRQIQCSDRPSPVMPGYFSTEPSLILSQFVDALLSTWTLVFHWTEFLARA